MVDARAQLMLTDVRYSSACCSGTRSLPSVAVLSLALGIGGAASVFTVLNAIVLRDLPVANPQQLYAAETHRAAEVRHATRGRSSSRPEAMQGRAELFAATPPTQMQVRLARGTDARRAEQRAARLRRVLRGVASTRAARTADRATRRHRAGRAAPSW